MSNSQVDKRSIETKVGTQKMCERETNFCGVGYKDNSISPRGVEYKNRYERSYEIKLELTQKLMCFFAMVRDRIYSFYKRNNINKKLKSKNEQNEVGK